MSWVDQRAAAAAANDFLLELFGDVVGDDTPTSAGDERPASTAATQVAMNKGRGADASGLSGDIAAPEPGEPQASEGQGRRIAAPQFADDDQQGAQPEQMATADPGSALSQPVAFRSVLPLSAPPSVRGAPVSLPRASRPAWPYLGTAADGSDGRGSRARVEEDVPDGVDIGPSWGGVDPLEGLELLLDLDDLGPSRSVGADATGPIGTATGDQGLVTQKQEPRWDAWLGPAARRAKLGELTTKLLGMARTRGFVTLHELARAAAWLRHDAALLDELCARLDAEGVCATQSVAHTSLLGASLEGIAARFASLLARTPDERAILRRLGYGPKLIAELSAESRAFTVRAFALHQLTRAQEEELVRVVIAARSGPAGVGDGAAVERAKLALFHDNLWIAVRLAPRYRGRGVPLNDLIQEGCLGILKAIDRYELGMHSRFMGYAAIWVVQRIQRAIGDTGRTVRLPIHLQDQLRGMAAAERSLSIALGRAPTLHELAARLEVTPERVRDLALWRRPALSLDVPNAGMAEALERTLAHGDSAVHDANVAARLEGIEAALAALTPRMRQVLDLRLGLSSGSPATLEEVGQTMGVTRERIRQIERGVLDRLHADLRRYQEKQAAADRAARVRSTTPRLAAPRSRPVRGAQRGLVDGSSPFSADRERILSAPIQQRPVDVPSPQAAGIADGPKQPCLEALAIPHIAVPNVAVADTGGAPPQQQLPRAEAVPPARAVAPAAAARADAAIRLHAEATPILRAAAFAGAAAGTAGGLLQQGVGSASPSQTALPLAANPGGATRPAAAIAEGTNSDATGVPGRAPGHDAVPSVARATTPPATVEAATPKPDSAETEGERPAPREEVFPLCPALLPRRAGATLLDELLFVRGLLGTRPTTQQFVEALLRWPKLLLPKGASRALTARGALDCYYVLGLINPTRIDAPSLVPSGRWSMDLAELQRRCFWSLRRRVAYMDAAVALLAEGTLVRVPDLAGALYRTAAAKGWQIEEAQGRLELLAGLGLVTKCDEAYQARPMLLALVAQGPGTPSTPPASPAPSTAVIPAGEVPDRATARGDACGGDIGPQEGRTLREGVVNWALLGPVPQAAAPLQQAAQVALFTIDDPYAGLDLLDDLSDYCIPRAEPKQGSIGFDIAG